VGGGEGADRVDEGVREEMALGEEVAGEGGLAGASFSIYIEIKTKRKSRKSRR